MSPASKSDGTEPGELAKATVHQAALASGGTGAVEWGEDLTDPQAVARRHLELDLVVRGPDKGVNRKKAREIEEMVGKPVFLDLPHARAGPMSLPHYHQVSRQPPGHTFYEVDKRKARKGKP